MSLWNESFINHTTVEINHKTLVAITRRFGRNVVAAIKRFVLHSLIRIDYYWIMASNHVQILRTIHQYSSTKCRIVGRIFDSHVPPIRPVQCVWPHRANHAHVAQHPVQLSITWIRSGDGSQPRMGNGIRNGAPWRFSVSRATSRSTRGWIANHLELGSELGPGFRECTCDHLSQFLVVLD